MDRRQHLVDLSPDELVEVDQSLGRQPIEPVLRLWEELRAIGDMPSMGPMHVRAMALAIREAEHRGRSEK